jgi:hypothetical protein
MATLVCFIFSSLIESLPPSDRREGFIGGKSADCRIQRKGSNPHAKAR